MAQPQLERTARRPRRLLRRVAVAAGCALLALTVVVTLVLVLIDGDVVAERAKQYVLPPVSEALGREVSASTLGARILPNPHVILRDVVVQGRRGEPPLIEAEALDVDLALWPLVRSLGREIRVQRVELVRPEVNAVRNRQGQWSFEGLGRQRERGAEDSSRQVSIGRIAIQEGTLRIIDRSGVHGEATVGLTHVDLEVENVARAEPIRLRGSAAFASDQPNLSLELTASSLPSSWEDLRVTGWPELRGKVRVDGAQLTRLEGLLPAKLAGVIRGGAVALDATLSTTDGSYLFETTAGIDALRLRGEPSNGSLHVLARLDPANPAGARAHIDQLVLQGPGIDLRGTASFVATPVRFDFALHGPVLDLRSVLGTGPVEETEATGSRTAALPAGIRRQIEGVALHGSLDVERVVSGKLEATRLSAIATLERGILRLDKAGAELYGGRVDASGTTVNLLAQVPKWNLKARLSNVDLGGGGLTPMRGKVDAAMDLRGRGADWEEVRRTVTGTGALALTRATLAGADLAGAVARAVAAGLSKPGRAPRGEIARRAARPTEIDSLSASFEVHDGWLHLREPLTFVSNAGAGRLDGRIGLDQALDLRGTVLASPELLASMLRGTGLRPSTPVEVPLAIHGTLRSPEVDVNEAAVAERLVAGRVRSGAKKAEDAVRRQARRRVDDLMEQVRRRRRP